MGRNIIYILFALLFSVSMNSCHEDIELEQTGNVGEEVWTTLRFGYQDYENVTVTTRATLDDVPEARVQNIFVFIFYGEQRIYAHYFDNDNLVGTEAAVKVAPSHCWYVENMQRNSDGTFTNDTHGTIRVKAPQANGTTMYLIANIDADMVNISPEKLNMIKTKSDVESLTATLNQKTTSRNGYFPMVAKVEDVNITATEITSSNLPAQLERLDAKIQVNFRVAVGNVIVNEKGDTIQMLKAFEPQSWQIKNIPLGANMVSKTTDYEASGYFDSEEVAFETRDNIEITYHFKNLAGIEKDTTVNTLSHGFSFYMVENRESANKKNSASNVHNREKRIKNATGEYDTSSSNLWLNAPENATYMVVKGEVQMEVDVSSEAKKQQLAANVTYYIHLGDITNSFDNYDIERNTKYTYNIIIKGVNAIEVEVASSQSKNASKVEENQAGATGMVYIARESIFTFDSHYGQRVISIDQEYIDPKAITWFVSTPFGKEGTPYDNTGTANPTGMDYKWVQFMVNQKNSDGSYNKNNQSYPGYKGNPYQTERSDSLQYITEFTEYIQEQKSKFDKDPKSSDFKKELDEDWKAAFPDDESKWYRYRIYATIFVNEFYYEEHPISGDKSPDLWKRFVNKPNRMMHILCDNQKSLDKESSSTGSVITIRQRSIQTPYNLNKASLTTAWGTETEDEMRNSQFWFYSTEEENNKLADLPSVATNKGNTSSENGRINTAKLWGLVNGTNYSNTIEWTDYLDYNRENDHKNNDGYYISFLIDDKATMLYAPLLRNRDNNGNGKIDADEIRWYIASMGQLYGIYMGELGLNTEAKLYTEDMANATGTITTGPFAPTGVGVAAAKWKNHVVSSTKGSNNGPRILWAEEGISTSNYRQDLGWGLMGYYTIRCLRNLGMDYSNEDEAKIAIVDETHYPEDLIKVIRPTGTITKDSEYKFDLSNINDKSLRYYTTHELEPANERAEMARTYYGFKTGPISTKVSDYSTLKTMLEKGGSPCETDWRVPNVREGALMYLYCNDADWWKVGDDSYETIVSTYYSRNNTRTWHFHNGYASLDGDKTVYIRSVQDWDPNE